LLILKLLCCKGIRFVYCLIREVKIIKNIDEIPAIKNPVVTVGSFDGVHLGHRTIIQHTIALAKQINGESVVITFSPHPQLVLHPNEKALPADKQSIFILNTVEEKIKLLNLLGVDYLLVVPFTKEFAALPYNEFIKDFIAERIHAKSLVIGYDHHFGSNREGSIKHLLQLGAEYSFAVEEVPAQKINDIAISSTKIRKALIAGNIAKANLYLGYDYSLSGHIIRGNGLGKQLGFPTANIEPDNKEKLIPADGAYAVTVDVNGINYMGMLNTGIRPTIGGVARVIEVNIFDFSSDIYGKKIEVNFIDRLRSEIKFEGMDELKKQLLKDKENALKILS
jgi:riboflavin kinase / FMN adenylyltransferase